MVFEEKYELTFTVDAACMEKIIRLRALLSNGRLKKPGLEGMLNILLDEYIDRHGPEGRTKRREKAQKNKKPRANAKRSRHIPQAVRDAVYLQRCRRQAVPSAGASRGGSYHTLCPGRRKYS